FCALGLFCIASWTILLMGMSYISGVISQLTDGQFQHKGCISIIQDEYQLGLIAFAVEVVIIVDEGGCLSSFCEVIYRS
ncbi:MAG: hypothetical protein AABZ76_14280, partial [Pseudomonadota bacterium]